MSERAEFTGPNYREKLDISQVFLRQLDRTNFSAATGDGSYESYVRQTMRLLPVQWQQWVQDQSDRYTVTRPVLVFLKKMGTRTNPALRDRSKEVLRLADDTIDFSDPNILSPKLQEKTTIDYEILNSIIGEAAELAGLSWQTEATTYDLGRTDKNKKKQVPRLISHSDSGRPYQDNPKGLDTRIIGTIPDTDIKIMDWNGTMVAFGPGYAPRFLDIIASRRKAGKSNILVVTGSPGEGKSWFGMRLGEIFDNKFDPYIQIPFNREHLLWLISEKSPLKEGQVILVDEAHFGMGARRWHDSVQQDLMDQIAAVRSKGYIIIIIVLHLDMIDKIVRKFVLSFMCHMEDRGHATAYRLYTPRFQNEMHRKRIGTIRLQVPDPDLCEHPGCLRCKSLKDGTCLTTRAIYERRKRIFVDEMAAQAKKRIEEKEKKKMSRREIVVGLLQITGTIKPSDYTQQKRLKQSWVIRNARTLWDVEVGQSQATNIRNEIEDEME